MLLILLACAPATTVFSPGPSRSESGTDDHAVENFALVVDADTVTMVHATWKETGEGDSWVEYRWEGGDWLVAPRIDAGSAVLLGIPAETPVEARAVADVGGETRHSQTAGITTGSLPGTLLQPGIDVFEPDIALDAEYTLIAVDHGSSTFAPPYLLEIFDRQGRIVWYTQVADNLMSFYPTVSLDGTHIWYDANDLFGFAGGSSGVIRRTLDRRWSKKTTIQGMGQAVAEGPDESFIYEIRMNNLQGLGRIDADGQQTTLWDCGQWMQEQGTSAYDCYMNTCNWDAARNTVLASMFTSNTVIEVDLDTARPVRQMGQLTVGDPYTFIPADSVFDYQHNPYWTEDGTLLVSTHVVDRHHYQVAGEYEIDDDARTITRIWSYESSDLWATQLGEATRLPNGNTLEGYGQDGALREVTPNGEVAFQVRWDTNREGYRVVGHATMIDDLYALNRGPAR